MATPQEMTAAKMQMALLAKQQARMELLKAKAEAVAQAEMQKDLECERQKAQQRSESGSKSDEDFAATKIQSLQRARMARKDAEGLRTEKR
jgi:hypothetical protein